MKTMGTNPKKKSHFVAYIHSNSPQLEKRWSELNTFDNVYFTMAIKCDSDEREKQGEEGSLGFREGEPLKKITRV